MEQPTFEKLVRVYVRIREARLALERDMESQIEALKAQQAEVGLALKDAIRALGENTTSVNTSMGTVVLTKKTRYYPQDWDAFKTFVRDNDALDLLEKRIAQGNLSKYLEENPDNVPPGLNSTTEYDVSVRKARAS